MVCNIISIKTNCSIKNVHFSQFQNPIQTKFNLNITVCQSRVYCSQLYSKAFDIKMTVKSSAINLFLNPTCHFRNMYLFRNLFFCRLQQELKHQLFVVKTLGSTVSNNQDLLVYKYVPRKTLTQPKTQKPESPGLR